MQKRAAYTTIDAYIALFPEEIQGRLRAMRAAIHAAAPEATEKISYQMPTFYLEGNLVHFAALKRHIGFYPTPSGIEAFKEELSGYVTSKGALQFPLNSPLPLELVGRITRYRAAENLEKAQKRKKANKTR